MTPTWLASPTRTAAGSLTDSGTDSGSRRSGGDGDRPRPPVRVAAGAPEGGARLRLHRVQAFQSRPAGEPADEPGRRQRLRRLTRLPRGTPGGGYPAVQHL